MKALLPLAAAAVLLALPGHASSAPDKPRCHVVVKIVHGKKKHVRICTKPKPKPKPKPQAHSFKRVDVGGYKLAIDCRGSGSPAVVLDSGFSTSRYAWLGVLPKVSSTTRICAYDRAGLGDSANRPAGIEPTTGRIVEELHTLLARAGVPGPYVLGGWSMGGFDVRYYTKRSPNDVSGLVLVDATPSAWIQAVFGGRLESPFETMLAGDAAAELEPPPSLGSRPLVDLTHGIALTPADVPEIPDPEQFWIDEQKKVTLSSTNSLLVRADGNSHNIPGENPALIAEGIKLVVGSVRVGSALPACSQTRIPQLHGTCLAPS